MIGEDDVRYVAKLARLRLEQDEVARMTGELAKILAHIDKMSELDIGATCRRPRTSSTSSTSRAPTRPRPSLPRDEALRNAPAVSDDCFRVPRMG